MKKIAGLVAAVAMTAMAQAALGQTSVKTSVVVPTETPAAAATLSVLQKVCLPLLQGADLKTIAGPAGLKSRDGQWVLPIQDKTNIELEPPDASNPHVCTAIITHRPGENASISTAVGDWAKSQAPPLQPMKVQQASTGATYLYTTSSWTAQTPRGTEAVVLSGKKTLQGQPVLGDLGQTTLLVSLNPA